MSEMAGKRYALIVGVGAYREDSELTRLDAPLRDVEGVTEILTSDACKFDVEPLRDPDSGALRRALERFYINAGRDDVVLFYFSGHGRLGKDRSLHLCTSDTQGDILSATAVSLTWLTPIIDDCRAANVVIVFDCCFSGAAVNADVSSVLNHHLGKGRGKYLMTSSTALQESLERPGEEYSLFTKWFIQGLKDGAADQNDDNITTAEELYQYVEQKVTAEQSTQRPLGWGSGVDPGSMIMARHAGATGPSAPLRVEDPDFFNAVRRYIDQGKIIPFLGGELYSDDSLNSFALAKALGDMADSALEDGQPVATAAQYLERYFNDRQDFLECFQQILVDKSKNCGPTKTHALFLGMEPPQLVISATYDNVFERLLEGEGRPHVIVSHILRSADGEHDGKILVVRRGDNESVEIMPADELIVDERDDRVIYKVLGSPFLHDYVDPGLELDTVVVTESDHVMFLGRLENQHTRVPTAFSMPLKTQRLLFLGYTLDVWQYRLVMQAFSNAGKERYAVRRRPISSIEALSWRRLGAELIPMQPESFSQAILDGRNAA